MKKVMSWMATAALVSLALLALLVWTFSQGALPTTAIDIGEHGLAIQEAGVGAALVVLATLLFSGVLVMVLVCTLVFTLVPLVLLAVAVAVLGALVVSLGLPLLAVLGVAALLLAPFVLIIWALVALLRRLTRDSNAQHVHP
jgi:hypothetical protein